MNMIGIIGGSGLYDFEGFESKEWRRVSTPFGAPSDEFLVGRFGEREVAFLPRHGRGHRLLPFELNHRANIWGFKSLGVRFIISVGAVGSLQEKYRPLDIVFPDQFIDRTKRAHEHTFFGEGIVAHIGFGDPICKNLQQTLYESATQILPLKNSTAPKAHLNGTYLNMEGPAFSTRAESKMYRQLGADIIGMTNLGEAKLSREAEISYASMGMITDYDAWKEDEAHVSVDMIVKRLHQNAATAKEIIKSVIPKIPLKAQWPCHESLKTAIITDRKIWPASTIEKLKPILATYL